MNSGAGGSVGLLAVDGSYVQHVLPVMIVLGFGFGIGISFPALMTLAMSGATQSDAGLASGLVNTAVQVGGALGLAVLATLSANRGRARRHGTGLRGGRVATPAPR
jgi:predicted MFS family arabinose efflux permease